MTTELISAQELHDARVKREVLARLRDGLNKEIADLDLVLAPKPPNPPSHPSASDLQRLAESQPWRSNTYGEGCFCTNVDGSDRVELKPLLEAISRAGGKLVLGHHEYYRNGKFLNRRAA